MIEDSPLSGVFKIMQEVKVEGIVRPQEDDSQSREAIGENVPPSESDADERSANPTGELRRIEISDPR